MKIALVTCVWKRHKLTRLMFRHHKALQRALAPDINLRLIAVGSEGWRSRRLAEREGWEYLEYDNMPLSDKFNYGIARLDTTGRLSPDAVMVLGSDDFLTGSYFLHARRLIDDGAQYLVANGCHFLCTRSRRAIYLGSHTTGGGRVLTSELLDVLEWHPYISGALSGIDVSMQQKVQAHFKSDRYTPTGPMRLINTNPGSAATLLGVKTGLNLWSFERMAQSITSRYVDLSILDAFGQTGRLLADWEPWKSRRWQRRLRELDLSTRL